MRFIDTHTHLYLDDYDGEADAVVERAIDSGVTKMVFPAVAPDTAQRMFDLASHFPDNLFVATGLHPTEVKDDADESLSIMMKYLQDSPGPIVAVGEIGIDKHWDTTFIDKQMQVLEIQARAAVNHNLPVLIHCRDGIDETLEVLGAVKGLRGVFHSFGGDATTVERIRRDLGDFYFGINGIVTFKNSQLREVLPTIGLDRILLETDAPWLAPVPHRGRRNESAYIPFIAAHIAHSMNLDLAEVAHTTTQNAQTLLGI